MSHIYGEYSEVSCGVHQLYGFTAEEFNGRVTKKKAELLTFAVLSAIADDLGNMGVGLDSKRGPCLHYLFSDRKGRGAGKFYRIIRKTWPNQRVIKMDGRNPNSGHLIETVLWEPDFDEIRRHPLWSKVVDDYTSRTNWRYDEQDEEW